ncbi:MAG: pyrroline-5-carboxylate reductase [Campylobacterota bacterium]|nr:pyrroline-5-carboxylate reductase [Campylobacterota bacterium]
MKLTIIGSGAMAIALADGLIEKYELEFFARDEQKLDKLSKRYKTSCYLLDHINIDNKNILLSVKPYALDIVAAHLHGQARTLYSILAGTSIKSLNAQINAEYTVRAMPNIAAAFGASATTLTGDDRVKNEAVDIFNAIGESLWLNSEKELDIATAVAGSGPAYLALVAEAMMDGAVKQGVRREDSIQLVQALFKGFSPLLEEQHPALIKDLVMSPGGTTAAGYATLEAGRVRDGFIKAIEAAFKVTQR